MGRHGITHLLHRKEVAIQRAEELNIPRALINLPQFGNILQSEVNTLKQRRQKNKAAKIARRKNRN